MGPLDVDGEVDELVGRNEPAPGRLARYLEDTGIATVLATARGAILRGSDRLDRPVNVTLHRDRSIVVSSTTSA